MVLPTDIPPQLAAIFVLLTFAMLYWFGQGLKETLSQRTYNKIYGGMVIWLLIQAVLAIKGFYFDTHSMPPRVALVLLPPVALILVAFNTPKGIQVVDTLPLSDLSYLHTSRVVVEITLYYLFIYHQIPQMMTFEGRNFDILAGITAPIVAFLYFKKRQISERVLLAWNIFALLLVLNVLTYGILSVPTPFQQLAFEQPNVAVLKFPFVWLPSFVVPLVVFSHLVAIRRLLRK